ncbi:MAG: CBS domain-containing protein [Gammaproteobacteria bacterium]|nr:CBS domain-containing protein [Gammaproteobacteria bacterium]
MANNAANITAQEIMTPEVLLVQETWSIKQLADFFVEHRISGAPVVNHEQHFVGVVSISDMVQFDSMTGEEKANIIAAHVYTEVVGQKLNQSDINRLASHANENCNVKNIMTPKIIDVKLTTTLPEIAGIIFDNHIHRVFVTQNKEIVGVISTTNILGKIAQM